MIVTKEVRAPSNNERLLDYYAKRLAMPDPLPNAYRHHWDRYEPDGVDPCYFQQHSYTELSRGF